MLTKKQLLKRIKSLEEHLGVKYVPGDANVVGYSEESHVNDTWGFRKKTSELLEKADKKKIGTQD